ncbi:MAG: GAF domain-containing sensor histidine kinase [Chloroflexi bacterium]|nr:GAF domain-containing sensor histidine kinase [Chloroflexota bacterium]
MSLIHELELLSAGKELDLLLRKALALLEKAGEMQEAEEMLRTISAGTAAVTGADFFRLLVRHLADVMRVNSAFITECTDKTMTRVRTLAFLEDNDFLDNMEYDLEGTACEGVIAGSICYYSARVHEMFPKEEGVESYLGVPVHNTTGEILGHLAIIDIKPMPPVLEPHRLAILQIFAARAGAELDRLRTLAALQRAKDDLEVRVVERTAELSQANRALRQEITERQRMEAERERLIDELDAFAHTVAHDLKNPLTGILAYGELLQTDWATETDRQRAAAGILKNGQKMSAIIKELLTLAEMRQVEEVAWQPLDMDRIVREAQQRLEHAIEAGQARIVRPAAWPAALGYAPWVEEVWANYLSNGLKYGGRPPRLELGGTAQPDGMVRFWVRDNGQGLAAEEQARRFRPFTRLNQVQVTGHGLGLSIVQRIVSRLGGQVGVESEPGQGSVFYFTLPAAGR